MDYEVPDDVTVAFRQPVRRPHLRHRGRPPDRVGDQAPRRLRIIWFQPVEHDG
jgi:hypothetical protein